MKHIVITLMVVSLLMMATIMPFTAISDAPPGIPSGMQKYIIVFNDPSFKDRMGSIKNTISSLGGSVDAEYGLIPGIYVTVPMEKESQLKNIEGVSYVEDDMSFYLMPIDPDSDGQQNTNVPASDTSFEWPDGGLEHIAQIGADRAWEQGVNGSGVIVGIIDTGIDATHPDLANRLLLWKDFVYDRAEPFDYLGHGTHVAGLVAGTGNASVGNHKGVAPGAMIAMAQVFHRDSGYAKLGTLILAMDWCVDNNASIISMSLGGRHSQALDDAVHKAVACGVVVVAAAGNSGSWGISCPGDSPDAITVGAVNGNDTVTYWSSRGPTYDGRIKPDITAPGLNIISTSMFRKGHTSGEICYIRYSGTSMATPIVAGTVALVLQANPLLTPEQVKTSLTSSAKPLGGSIPNNDYGYGRVQADAAVSQVRNMSVIIIIRPSALTIPHKGEVSG